MIVRTYAFSVVKGYVVIGDVQWREEEVVADGVNDNGFPPGHLKHETYKNRLRSVASGRAASTIDASCTGPIWKPSSLLISAVSPFLLREGGFSHDFFT